MHINSLKNSYLYISKNHSLKIFLGETKIIFSFEVLWN